MVRTDRVGMTNIKQSVIAGPVSLEIISILDKSSQIMFCAQKLSVLYSIHQSAKTLKPLTGEMNNDDYLVTMQCSAGS